MEARVYAEDSRTLLPQTGRLLRYREPAGPGVRVDSGVVEGGTVSVYYDPLLAKVIAHGATRDEALGRLRGALAGYEILGLRHNLAFLGALLDHPDVRAGRTYTRFIEDRLAEFTSAPPETALRAAAAVAAFVASADPAPLADGTEPGAAFDPWDRLGAGRLVAHRAETPASFRRRGLDGRSGRRRRHARGRRRCR